MITEADIRWAYKYLLGRAPDSADAVDYHLRAHGTDREKLWGAFFGAEGLDRVANPTSLAEFIVWKPDRPKLVVAGNCQGPNLARAAAGLADVSIYGFDILNFPDRQSDLVQLLDDADHIVLPLLGEEFGPLESGVAKQTYGDKVRFFSLPFFEGVHPDITYLGQRGERIRSPVGDYHSKIVLRAFLAGLTVWQCLDRFSDGALLELDPKKIFSQSRDEFLRREQHADLRLGKWFFKTIKQRPLLYTINHPTADVFIELARQAFVQFDIPYVVPHAMLTQITLSANTIWPVHGSIARKLGLRYSTGDMIYTEHYAMDLPEFIRRAYAFYTRAGHDEVALAARERGVI